MGIYNKVQAYFDFPHEEEAAENIKPAWGDGPSRNQRLVPQVQSGYICDA